MVAGRNDLAFVQQFNSGFSNYSDDGETLHGAYGFRWRKNFGVDQVAMIIEELRTNENSRRCVLSMWDAPIDLCLQGKDFPCNTHIYFRVHGGKLEMTVCCRSNDLVWGAYGANAFHMSFLQEVMATELGLQVGNYTQVSNNYHLYTEQHGKWLESPEIIGDGTSYYDLGSVTPYPIITTHLDTWETDLNLFFNDPLRSIKHYADPFFAEVAAPMYESWYNRKHGISDGLDELEAVKASDIKRAVYEWIMRRKNKASVVEGRPA